MNSAGGSWTAANERVLRAAVAVVHARLLDAAKAACDGPATRAAPSAEVEQAEAELSAARAAAPAAAALDQLAALFGLSSFETDLLLLCAGVELDASLADLCRQAMGSGAVPCPTFGLGLAVLPDAHWSALVPTAPLRHWHLVHLAEGDLLTTRPLRVDERILHELVGVGTVDGRLVGRMRSLRRGEPAPTGSQVDVARRAARLWAGAAPEASWPLIQLVGPPHADLEPVAVEVAALAGLGSVACSVADLPPGPAEQELLARLLEREAALVGTALVIDLGSATDAAAGLAFVARLGGPVLVHAATPVTFPGRGAHRFDLAPPTRPERIELWRAVAGGSPPAELRAVAERFPLGPRQIAAAALDVPAIDAPSGALWDACRRAARPHLARLARHRPAVRGWDGLVLPPQQLDMLAQLTAQARHQALVQDDWGFATDGPRGLGITALFAGPSGTGKTTAAEVVAAELALDLFCVDLSTVVDKYIGETEKNLGRVFDAAEGGAAVLLFDEADALFGKRSEVRDSHDRYANLEVAYLLQRMEEYQGLAILTTNARSALDPAFLRRLRFVVTFPFPEPAQRAELWRRAFPAGAPTQGLDPNRLARLTVAGGSIRNIALNAAFLAADASRPITTADIVRAARAEYAKLERPLSEVELRGLV